MPNFLFRKQICGVSLTHSLTHSLTRVVILAFVLILLLASALPALAGYLGPDCTRTETVEVCKVVLLECQYVPSKDLWKYKVVEDWSCSNEGKPWKAYPESGPECWSGVAGAQYWEKQYQTETIITTYPEAVISGTLDGCTARNGWCSTAPILSLTASEPVSGYAITLIEGARNGEAFACSGASCDVPLLEGENNFTFWALSSWGDSSRMGSLSARVDTLPPQIEGSLSGTPGEAGWYVSAVTLSASASDPAPGSGIETFTYTLNASPEIPYTAPLTLNDGAHTLTLRARDAAGHITELSQSAQVDTLMPQAGLTLSAASFCPECGQTLEVLIQASDSGSGLEGWQVFLDGAPWQSGSQTEQAFTLNAALAAGSHTLRLEVRDAAGNLQASEAAFFVLAPTPTALPPAAPADTVPQPTLPPPTVTALNTPSPTPAYLPSLTPDISRLATKTAIPTRTPVVSAFQSPNLQSNNLQSHNLQSHNLQSNNLLWGAAALTAIAGATGLVLAAKRRREEEEERQAAEVRAQAEAKTEALRRQKEHQRLLERIQNYLLSQQMKKAQEAAARQAQHRAMDAKIEREEQKEEAAWEAWKSRSQTLAAQRAEQQRQQAAAAYQAYRQGERAEPQPVTQPQEKPWWQKAGDWLQQKVVQPVQQVAGSIVNALKPPQTAGSTKLAASVKDDEPPPEPTWWEKVKEWWRVQTIKLEPPDYPLPDTGSGEHGTRKPTLADFAFEKVLQAGATQFRLQRYDNAARHMDHYLGNSGRELKVSVDEMMAEMPQFMSAVQGTLTNMVAKNLGNANLTQGVELNFESGWTEFYALKTDSPNWFYAMGGYYYWVGANAKVLSVKENGNTIVKVVYKVAVSDYYNWDAGKSTSFEKPEWLSVPSLPETYEGKIIDLGNTLIIQDTALAELHKAGIAKEYHIAGQTGKIVIYYEYDPATSKLVPINP